MAKAKDLTFVDSLVGFEITYPSQFLPGPKKEGAFYYSAEKTFLFVHGIENMTRHSWKAEYEKCLQSLVGYKITYKTFRPYFFVLSGYKENGHIFYLKEIPFERDGKWMALKFDMNFPKEEKETWDPILKECANSLKPIQVTGLSPFTLGWNEVLDDSTKEKLLGMARQWIDRNVSCDQMSTDGDLRMQKAMTIKCSVDVDDYDIPFFGLDDSETNQFILVARGPSRQGEGCGFHGSNMVCDQKYVLFSCANGKITGKIIYENKDGTAGYPGTIEVIGFQNGEKGLLLNDRDNHCDCGLTGHLFMRLKGEVKSVLIFNESYEPCTAAEESAGGGFSSILIPQDKGYLRLLKQNYEMVVGDEEMVPGKYSYSETIFKFDPSQGAYTQVGPEKILPKKSAAFEWTQVNTAKN